MLSFMYAHLAFFHQGYDLFSELGPYMKDLGAQVISWTGSLGSVLFVDIYIFRGI
jgi:Arf-GAP/coiled-coil/ANK repeat/PH domain-containing protein